MVADVPLTLTSGRPDAEPLRRAFGLAVVTASLLYFATDVIEAAQGGFSTAQLWLTLIAEACIPLIVLGLALAQRPHLGRMGWVSAWVYAYSYVFFTGTVIYALVNDTPDYAALQDAIGPLMVVHGALMVAAGLGFGAAVLRAGVLPRWAAVALMAGVVLVAASQSLPEAAQAAIAGIRALGFAGMGFALVRTPTGASYGQSAGGLAGPRG